MTYITHSISLRYNTGSLSAVCSLDMMAKVLLNVRMTDLMAGHSTNYGIRYR